MYKFKSKASGDVILLQAHGDAFLRAIGREPAAKGIIEPGDIAGVLQALRAALAATPDAGTAGAANLDEEDPVSARQRWFPMVRLLEAAAAARVAVVWGV